MHTQFNYDRKVHLRFKNPSGPIRQDCPARGESQKAYLSRIDTEWKMLKAQMREQKDKEDKGAEDDEEDLYG
jgi:hypothetical protein